MKAFLLAAGLGTRLRPLTNETPKCLIPINGKPLLAYWIDLMQEHGITDVLINLHHLADKVRVFIENEAPPSRKHRDKSVKFQLYDETELLGSGGTLKFY